MKAQMFNLQKWVSEVEPVKLQIYFKKLLISSGFNIENYVEKHFEPFGYTALYLLSESHFAIHTFPEENKAYIELSSCIKKPFDNFKNNLDLK